MQRLLQLQTRHRLIFFVALLALASGCTLPFGSGDPDELTSPPPTCTVELNPLMGKPRQIELIVQDGMTVQTALEESKAARKYHDMELVLVRQPTAQSPEPHRLGANWDSKQSHVTIETDYAIYPGDVLIVNQRPRKTLGDVMMSDLLGPMAR